MATPKVALNVQVVSHCRCMYANGNVQCHEASLYSYINWQLLSSSATILTLSGFFCPLSQTHQFLANLYFQIYKPQLFLFEEYASSFCCVKMSFTTNQFVLALGLQNMGQCLTYNTQCFNTILIRIILECSFYTVRNQLVGDSQMLGTDFHKIG